MGCVDTYLAADTDTVRTVNIPLEEYKKLVEAKNSLSILLNSYGKFGLDHDTLQSVAKTIGFELPKVE